MSAHTESDLKRKELVWLECSGLIHLNAKCAAVKAALILIVWRTNLRIMQKKGSSFPLQSQQFYNVAITFAPHFWHNLKKA